jgi:hypothetical protein
MTEEADLKALAIWNDHPRHDAPACFLNSVAIGSIIPGNKSSHPLFQLFFANNWAYAKKTTFTPDEVKEVLFAFYGKRVACTAGPVPLDSLFDWYALGGKDLTTAIFKTGIGSKLSIPAKKVFDLLYYLVYDAGVPKAEVAIEPEFVALIPNEPSDLAPSDSTPSEWTFIKRVDDLSEPCEAKPAPKPDTGVARAIASMSKPRPLYYDPTFDLDE